MTPEPTFFDAISTSHFLGLVVLVAVGFGCLWWSTRLPRRDDDIDEAIARNAAKPCKNMERIDWHKTERAGETRWQETLRAQEKVRQQGSAGGRVIHSGRWQ